MSARFSKARARPESIATAGAHRPGPGRQRAGLLSWPFAPEHVGGVVVRGRGLFERELVPRGDHLGCALQTATASGGMRTVARVMSVRASSTGSASDSAKRSAGSAVTASTLVVSTGTSLTSQASAFRPSTFGPCGCASPSPARARSRAMRSRRLPGVADHAHRRGKSQREQRVPGIDGERMAVRRLGVSTSNAARDAGVADTAQRLDARLGPAADPLRVPVLNDRVGATFLERRGGRARDLVSSRAKRGSPSPSPTTRTRPMSSSRRRFVRASGDRGRGRRRPNAPGEAAEALEHGPIRFSDWRPQVELDHWSRGSHAGPRRRRWRA